MHCQQLQTKLGQLFILGFQGATATKNSSIIKDITRENLGGVILFERHLATNAPDNNILSASQTEELTSVLQETASNNGQPLLITIDQEGGAVSRLTRKHGFAETPAAAELATDESCKQTRRAAASTAAMLHRLGINLNFAPVADLDIHPQNPIIGAFGRSFSKDAATVTRHCAIWITEHHNRGILTCLKHFPGHGSSRRDSHHHFVDISTTWDEKELLPYQNLIRQRLADTVMVGHLFLRQLDEEWPAPLSEKILAILRNKLRFQGPIITDDMQMKAVTSRYGLAEACCRSLAAGVDLIVIGNNIEYDPKILLKVKKRIIQAVQNGELEEARITNAWQRVINIKNRLKK